MKKCEIKCKDCKCCLEYTNVKDDLLICKCLCCIRNYQRKINEVLKKRFANTYRFYSHDINKFILLLQKDVCPYECMDNWEKFSKKSLPEIKDFYCSLNMKNIIYVDHRHVKRVWKDFEIKSRDKYHDLHVQSNKPLVANVSEHF